MEKNCSVFCGSSVAQSLPAWTGIALPHCVNATDTIYSDRNYYQGAHQVLTNQGKSVVSVKVDNVPTTFLNL